MIPLICDVDGCMTDGTVSYPSKERKFNLRDGHGLELLRKRTNIVPFIMSGEADASITKRAEKLGIKCYLGVKNKYTHMSYDEDLWKIKLANNGSGYIAISDDIPDLELLQNATLAFCPADAEDEIKAIDGIIVLTKKGGEGCVREAINMILTQPFVRELLPELDIYK